MYLPNGNPAPGPKFDYKLNLFERLTGYSQSLLDSGAPAPISRGNRKFESISLQRGVSCECSRGERLFERTAGIDAVRVDRQAGALAGEA
jgi:hypothetical protein